ncbi:Basic leucine zipper 9, partial [Mucuna pruriens]
MVVKLAEDIVTRGPVCRYNNEIVQNQNQSQLSSPSQLNRCMAHVSPTITVHGNNAASYGGGITVSGQNSPLGLANLDMPCTDFNSDNAISSMTTMWP